MATHNYSSPSPDSQPDSTQSFPSVTQPYLFGGHTFLVEAWTERYVLVYLPGSRVPAQTAAKSPRALDAACAAILAALPEWGGEEPPPAAPTLIATPHRTCTERAQQQMVGATGLQNPRDAWAALAMERGIMVRTISRLHSHPTAAPAGK